MKYTRPLQSCGCVNCEKPECGKCVNCLGKKKFGGDGSCHKRCMDRMCLKLNKTIQITGNENSTFSKKAATAPLCTKKRSPLSEIPNQFQQKEKRMRISRDPERQVLPKRKRPPSATQPPPSPPQKKRAQRRTACGKCIACLRPECGKCDRCLKKAHFGGEGRCKDICFQRRCHDLYPQQKAKDEAARNDATKNGDRKKEKKENPKSSSKEKKSTTDIRMQRQRKKACGKCVACLRQDCGKCNKCLANLQVGGDAEICMYRRCYTLYPPQKKMDTDLGITMLCGELPSEKPENHFTLSKYLLEMTVSTRVEKLYASTIYGIPVPKTSRAVSDCENNHAEERIESQGVNPCDGVGCDREIRSDYNESYCEDCIPKGSTSALIKYLIQSDKDKQEFMKKAQGSSYQDYIQHLMENATLGGVSNDCVGTPLSKLSRIATVNREIANIYTGDINENSDEQNYSRLVDSFLGKPLRLFVPSMNTYHTGRIIDHRHLHMNKPSCTDLEGLLNMTEFFVQFPAGKDGRKVSYHHWLMIEEHALAIGMDLVWELSKDKGRVPAMIWLQSTREMVKTQMKFYETEKKCESTNDLIKMVQKEKTRSEYAIVRSFGVSEQFRLINVKNDCSPFCTRSNDTTMIDCGDNPMVASQVLMAMTEAEERKRVVEWRRWVHHGSQKNGSKLYVPLILHPLHQDEQDHVFPPFHVSLFPNAVHGLDRLKIATELERRTKKSFSRSLLASIAGTIVPLAKFARFYCWNHCSDHTQPPFDETMIDTK